MDKISEKLSFRVDDPELLEFVYSLGRERSKVICALLRECMEEGGGYVSPRIMAATGFSYKNKKPIKGSGTSERKKLANAPTQRSAPPKKLSMQPVKEEPKVVEQVQEEPQSVPNLPPEPVTADEPLTADGQVSSAPKISNPAMIAAGLSAFSI